MNVTVDQLIARIGRIFRDLVIDRNDIIEWVYEAMEDGYEYHSFDIVHNFQIPVENGIARLPVNVYRVANVRTEQGSCREGTFMIKKRCIHVHSSATNVWVDMALFPMNTDGEPEIDETFAEAAMWFCIVRLLTDPWMRGELRGDAYGNAKMEYAAAAQKHRASFRNFTNKQLESYRRMLRSFFIVNRY